MTYYRSSDSKTFVYFNLMVFLLSFALLGVASVINSPSVGVALINLVIVCLLALMPLCIGATFINLYPDVWLEQDGFSVSVNIFWRTKIEWASIVSIKELPRKKGTLILAKKITPFHRQYGEKGLHGIVLLPCSEQLN